MFKRVMCVAATAILLSGCASTGRMARVDPAGVTAQMKDRADCKLVSQYGGDKEQSIDLDCYKFDKDSQNTAYQMASSGDKAEDYRNRLQSVLINQANFVCQLEKGRLYANRATMDSVFDFTSAGLSSASSIVSGDLAKSILSGVAGLSTATRSNLNANIYQNQLIPAITRVMDAERKDILISINARSKQTIADFNVDEMVRLANEYHQACSFEKGVQLLLNAALNKEGVDAIIRDINLRANANSLSQQIDGLLAMKGQFEAHGIDSAGLVKTITDLQSKYGEISLKMSENRQGTQTITSDVISEQGQ